MGLSVAVVALLRLSACLADEEDENDAGREMIWHIGFSFSPPLRDRSVPLSMGQRMFLNCTSNHSYAVFYGREVTVNTKIILCKQSFIENTEHQCAWISWAVRHFIPIMRVSLRFFSKQFVALLPALLGWTAGSCACGHLASVDCLSRKDVGRLNTL